MAGNKEAFQKAMNLGHSAAWDQDWEKAANCYKAALREMPESSQAHSSLGLALFEMQDFTAALPYYQRAATLAPEDPAPQEKIARIYERIGRLNEAIAASLQAAEMHLKTRSADKAIDNWQHVLSLQPENSSVRTRLAAVYERLGRTDEAAMEYIATASLFQQAGDLTRALKVVEYAQKIAPGNQEIRLALSMLRSNQSLPRPSRPSGSPGPARMANIRQMDSSDDENKESDLDPIGEARKLALVQLAGLLFDQAETGITSAAHGRGLSALTRGVGGGENAESGERTRIILHLGQAIDSQTLGDNNQAIVELEHALNQGLRHPAAYYDLGMLLMDSNSNSDRALRYLQQSVKHPDYTLASHLVLAKVHESTGHLQEAAISFIQALGFADTQLVPKDQAEELLNQYDALSDSQSGNEDQAALQSICKAVADQLLRPNWRAYLAKARQHLSQQAEGSSPVPVAEMVLETRSGQVVETMAQVRQLASQGMMRTAMEEALFALQYAPAYLPLHVLIGDLLLQDHRIHEAVKKYMSVSELYSVRGEAARSLRMLRRVAQVMPADMDVRQRLIHLLVTQDKTDEALKEYLSLADMYYHLAELDKARQTYLDALKIAQKSKDNRSWGVNLLLKVADIDLQQLNLRQALRVYEQIRTIQPDDSSARAQIVGLNFRLGQEGMAIKELDDYLTLLEGRNRRQEAIEFINNLLVDHSDRLDLRRRLADLYIHNKQIPEAVLQLDTAADTLVSANKHLEAINLLETIVSLNPPNVQEYKSALESLRRGMLRR